MTLAEKVVRGARPRRVAIYVRISADRKGEELGVKRQERDCRKRAAELRWEVVKVYVDNDVSATKSKKRPAYDQMVEDLRGGVVDAVLVWDLDRLYRRPAELEGFITLADELNIALSNIHGEYDLATPEGRLMARMKGNVAAYEAEQIGMRVKRKHQENAEAGRPNGGPRPWGYRYDLSDPDRTGRLVIVDREADIIRDSARRLLAGESLRSVCKDLNERGVPNPRGLEWVPSALRRSLQRQALIGKRVHKGEVIGDARWPAILDEATFTALHKLLSDPNRRTSNGNARKYLGTSIYRCGVCGETVQTFSMGGNRKVYGCRTRRHVIRSKEHVDRVVVGAVLGRLQRRDAVDLLRRDDPNIDTQALLDEASLLRARKAEAASLFTQGVIDGAQITLINRGVDQRLREIEALFADSAKTEVLDDIVHAVDIAAHWQTLSLARQRAIVDTLVEVTLEPVGRVGGCRFRPESVRVEWRG